LENGQTARRQDMTQLKERRRHIRKMADGMVAIIDGRVHPVVDISVAGLSIQCSALSRGQTVELHLSSLDDLQDRVPARVTVRAVGGALTHAEFFPTMRLLRYVINRLSEMTGIAPVSEYFR
jgi:hypothetical protein